MRSRLQTLLIVASSIVSCHPSSARSIPAMARCPSGTTLSHERDTFAASAFCARADGSMHGPWRLIADGTVTDGNYVDGLGEGTFAQRTSSGDFLGSYVLHQGSGAFVHRYASGEIESRGTLVRGRFDGERSYFRRDGITSMVERYREGRAIETLGQHYVGEIDHHDFCDGTTEGCPDAACAIRGREQTLRAVLIAADRASLTVNIERYDVAWTLSDSPRASLLVEAPLRFAATVDRAQLRPRLKRMQTLVHGGAFVRASAGSFVRPSHASSGLRVDVVLSAAIVADAAVRCEDLTLDASPSPNVTLDPLRGDGTLWRARARALTLRAAPGVTTTTTIEPAAQLRFARVQSRGEWTQIAWQQWDWSALSGWVRSDELLAASAVDEPDRSDSHAVADRADCEYAGEPRAVTLEPGATLHASANGAAWAQVTRPLAVTVSGAATDAWWPVIAIAGISASDDATGCRALEHVFVRATTAR